MNNSRVPPPLLGNLQLEKMVSGDELRFLQVGGHAHMTSAQRGVLVEIGLSAA